MININNTINPINHINPNKKLKINNKGNGTIIKMENIFKSENKLNKIKEFIKRLKIKEILENFKFDSSKILNLEWTK